MYTHACKNSRVGCHFLPQGIFPIQGSNQHLFHLLHWQVDSVPWRHLGSQKVKVSQSCLTLCNPMDYSPWNSPSQNTGVGSLSLLQGIFPTQGLNPGLPHCRHIVYQLSHKGSPRILEWVAYPSPGDLHNPEIEPRSLASQADSLLTELSGEYCLSLNTKNRISSFKHWIQSTHLCIFLVPDISWGSI